MRGGVGMAENAEDAAFLAQPVGVEVEPVRRSDRLNGIAGAGATAAATAPCC